MSNPNENPPISPIKRTPTFPHITSTSVASRTPFIPTDTPAINAAPVELDGGGGLSHEELKRRGTGDSLTGGNALGVKVGNGVRNGVSPGLEAEGEVEREFLAGGMGEDLREKRAAMLATRSKDPSVIVDVPREPTAEEVEAAKSAEGASTPLLVGEVR